MLQPVWATLTAAGVGAATWIAVAMVGRRREAWDSELYFVAALPFIALTATAISVLVPRQFWRWAAFPFAAQAVLMFLQNPTGGLLPLGLIVFGLFAGLCAVPAAAGAFIGRRIVRGAD